VREDVQIHEAILQMTGRGHRAETPRGHAIIDSIRHSKARIFHGLQSLRE
jgi:hypothetical protein